LPAKKNSHCRRFGMRKKKGSEGKEKRKGNEGVFSSGGTGVENARLIAVVDEKKGEGRRGDARRS